MFTPPELKDQYKSYMKMYASMLLDLADNEAAIIRIIHADDKELGLILVAVRKASEAGAKER